jgi:hypothetical protein
MRFLQQKSALESTRMTLCAQARESVGLHINPLIGSSIANGDKSNSSMSRSSILSLLSDDYQRNKTKKEIDLWALLQKKDTWKKLAATGGGWLIYDIAYCKLIGLF